VIAGLSCAQKPAPAPVIRAPAPVARETAAPPPAPPAAASTAAGAEAEPPVPARLTPDATFRADRPAAGPDRPFKLPSVKRFRLSNGLRVILAESPKLPLVSLELVVKSGAAANPRGKAGLAELTANMLDEGTKTRDALAIADEIATLGATLATGASWDASSVSVSGLSETFDQALAIWADVVLNPAFGQDDLERVRQNLLGALTRRRESPPQVASLAFTRLLYGEDHPYGWPTYGTEETLKALTAAELRRFYETHYTPTNAVLVAAGDITEAQLRAKLEAALKGWRARPAPRIVLPKAQTVAKTRIFLIDKPGAPQSSIRVGLVGLERRSPDYHKAMVMNHILGGSFKRLGLNLREQKGWTYGVSSVFEARRSPGPWTAGGEFVAAKTAESVEELRKEIRAMREADVTDRELAETKDEIVKAFPARFATVNQIAAQMAGLAVYDLPDNELESFTRKIAAVTKADVRKMAEKYLDPERLVIVVVGDQRAHERALRQLADVELRDHEGNPLPSGVPAAAAQ
jgi:zinc protease